MTRTGAITSVQGIRCSNMCLLLIVPSSWTDRAYKAGRSAAFSTTFGAILLSLLAKLAMY